MISPEGAVTLRCSPRWKQGIPASTPSATGRHREYDWQLFKARKALSKDTRIVVIPPTRKNS